MHQQFKPFPADLLTWIHTEPGDVPARTRQIGDEPGTDWIGTVGHDNRDSCGRLHSRNGVRVIPGNDDSSKAVALYARGIADAILEGRANAMSDVVKAVSAESADEFVEVENAAN